MAEKDTDNRATWALEIDGSGAKQGAEEAASATDKFRKSIDENIEALGQMGKSLSVLKKAGASGDSIKKLKDQMTAVKATMKSNIEHFEKSGGAIESLGRRKPVVPVPLAATSNLKAMSSAVSGVGGPLARLASQGESIASIFGKAKAAGVAGALAMTAAAAALVTVAVLGLVGALAHFAISAANSQRAELLMLEGMTKIPNWWGIAAGKATELQAAITSVSASVALGRDRVVGFAQDLYKAGLRGENLKQALEATAIATSAAGEAYGGVVKNWLAGAGMVGGNVGKLAQQFKNRFGAVARAQMLDINVQFSKMRENVRQLFSGLRIEGFLEALSKILGLFSETTAVGRALKGTLEILLQPIIDGFVKLQPIAKRFFQGVTIASLEFQIAVLKLRNRLGDTFGMPSLFKGIDWLNVALKLGQGVMWGFIAVVMTAAAAVGILVSPFVQASSTVLSFVRDLKSIDWSKSLWGQFESLSNLGERIGGLFGKLARKIVDAFKTIDWSTLGTDIWEGLKRGLEAGFVGIITLVKGMAKGIIKGFSSELKIGSPSKVFASFGKFTAIGYAEGVHAEAPRAQASVSNLLTLPDPANVQTFSAGTFSPPPSPAASFSGGTTVNTSTVSSGKNLFQFGDIHVHGASGDPKAAARSIIDELTNLLEGAQIHMGSLGVST